MINYINCLICRKNFTREDNLLRHMKTVHKIDTCTEDMNCSACKKIGWFEHYLKGYLETNGTYNHEVKKASCDCRSLIFHMGALIHLLNKNRNIF